ncbi:non-homologous end-joining DNA ligase [Nocardia tengchongensis]|uniref:non-homologous end-joining DNA ligase n=1 Tax=Nocardia tengchongensis TaxID=2055889 RepID=UPI00368A6C30
MVRIPAPMLATPGDVPGPSAAWAYELKFDGQRAIAWRESGQHWRIISRSLRDITATYPDVADALAEAAGARDGLMLDGEIVVLGARNVPSFSRLQQRMHARATHRRMAEAPAVFVAFDVLYEAGHSTMYLPYRCRREVLDGLELASGPVQVPRSWGAETDPRQLLAAASDAHFEGLVSKRVDSVYRSGRSRDWIKTVFRHSVEAVVIGFLGLAGDPQMVGSLLLAGHRPDGSLRYIGSAGTGFTDRARRVLFSALQQLQLPDPPTTGWVPRDVAGAARWVVPVIVADIECREVTAEGLLRHPSFRGVRADLDAAEVTLPQPYPVA